MNDSQDPESGLSPNVEQPPSLSANPLAGTGQTIQPEAAFEREVKSSQTELTPVNLLGSATRTSAAEVYPEASEDAAVESQADPTDYSSIADPILQAQKQARVNTTALDEIASDVAPDIQSRLAYRNKFLSDIGMSWVTWVLIEAVISGLIWWLKWPSFTYSIIIAPIIIYLIIKRS